MKKQAIEEIKRLCGNAMVLNNGWCHFVYHHLHYLIIPDETNYMIRISVPHVANYNDYKKEILDAAINETNRKVKYVKVVVLINGSISLNYDHRISNNEQIGEIIPHMIRTLHTTSMYLTEKLRSK